MTGRHRMLYNIHPEVLTLELFSYFKSLIEQDKAPVVICDTAHKIIYMNPAACRQYSKYGGEALLGRDLLACHNPKSREMINRVLDWFRSDASHNCVHTTYDEKQNKDIYMIALRGEQGALIGYYEKHEYRDRDMTPLYCMD